MPVPPGPLRIPEPLSHSGQFIRLDPLDPASDAELLHSISHGSTGIEQLWDYLPAGPFPSVSLYREFLESWAATPGVWACTVREAAAAQAPLGTISLMNVRPEHRCGELGNIWFCARARRTKANTEANYLLLQYCFEVLGYRRMEWKCNALNERSRRAALRLGFQFEGIFHQHMIVKGHNRDTAWFALLDHQWPLVKKHLQTLLAAPAPP